MVRKRRILIAPLNWGLGHASRCIPIIERFRAHNAEVVLAADGRPYEFFRNEYPDLELRRLRDIDISYAPSMPMLLSMLLQTPQLCLSFMNERRMIEPLIMELKIDGIVSDNRFGLYSSNIPCVYMTHQIAIRPPSGMSWTGRLLRYAHASLISRFTECWIPDSPGVLNLSGTLSHEVPLPSNAHFIGPLSRLSSKDLPIRYDCAAILSGPEPQRSIFESMILDQLRRTDLRAIVVRGTPERRQDTQVSPICTESGAMIDIVPSLPAHELNDVMNAAGCIIARSGYSTVMDLAALGKRAVLIPTPGQTEQEYLAQRLNDMRIFYSEPQSEFRLVDAIARARAFNGWSADIGHEELLDERIDHFLSLIA